MEEIKQDHLTGIGLHVDHEVRKQLHESGKWTKFISITVFIFCALILLFCLVGSSVIMAAIDKIMAGSGNVLAELSGGIVIAIIIIFVLLIAFVYYFLYNFSIKVRLALLQEDSVDFNKGLGSLKTFFIISSVLSILSLVISIFSLITG